MNAYQKKRLQWLLAGTVCAATGLYGGIRAAAQPEVTGATPEQRPGQEFRIMSAVIEDSLDTSQSDEWRGLRPGDSPFEAHVRAQYIPTVGAIFTVPVNFAIVDPGVKPPEPKTDQPATSAEQDLWEKNSKSDGFGPRGGGLGGGLGAEIGATYVGGGPVGAAYSKEKVDALQATLTNVLAKYGHKLDSVKADERVIVIVDAPGTRGPGNELNRPPRFQDGRGPGAGMRPGPPPGGGRGPDQGPPPGPGGHGPKQGPPNFDGPGQHEGPPLPGGRGPHQGPPPHEGRGHHDGPPPPPGGHGPEQGPPGGGPSETMYPTPFGMKQRFGGFLGGGQDHLLISAPKSALTAGQTKEGLASSLKIVSY
jgi:hypothetical protein